MTVGVPSAAPVRSWQASDEGRFTAALSRRCRKKRSDRRMRRGIDGTKRTVTRAAETKGTTRTVIAGSALGPWPNTALQRTRPLLRFWMNLKVLGWGPCR